MVSDTARRRGRRKVPLALLLAGLLIVVAQACTSSGTDGTGDDGGGTGDTVTTGSSQPGSTTTPEPLGIVIAHRGASAEAPEHTFAAYDRALEQGADYLEQDLQLTADGELVVLHDPVLDRVATGPAEHCTGEVATKTLEQLRTCEVGSWFDAAVPERADPSHADQRIPTLAEVLDRYGDDTRYYIEIKAPEDQPGMVDALLATLDAAGLDSTGLDGAPQVVIQSFSAPSLMRLHERRPDLVLVQLVRATDPADDAALDEIAGYADGIGPAVVLVDGALVAAAHERCLDVHPYTVDDPALMGTLLDLGVDGMFTNVPGVLVSERGAHAPPPEHC